MVALTDQRKNLERPTYHRNTTELATPPSKRNQTPNFVFKNVLPYRYSSYYVLLAIALIPAVLFYVYVASPLLYHGALPLSFAILIIALFLLIKVFARTVVIYFDDAAMYIADGNRQLKRVTKQNVIGLYAFDYEQRPRSHISVMFKLKNGDKLYLTDGNAFEQKDAEKAAMLKQFLRAALKRLELVHNGSNRWRALQGVGANWYSRADDNFSA